MQLIWDLHPKQINVQQAHSAAYQYTLLNYDDGRAELSVQHQGDRPDERPIKRFVYKNRNGAFGGAQRFEDQHGYRTTGQPTFADRAEMLEDLRWLLSEIGHEHWQNCDLDGDECYVCKGYREIKDKWNDKKD